MIGILLIFGVAVGILLINGINIDNKNHKLERTIATQNKLIEEVQQYMEQDIVDSLPKEDRLIGIHNVLVRYYARKEYDE